MASTNRAPARMIPECSASTPTMKPDTSWRNSRGRRSRGRGWGGGGGGGGGGRGGGGGGGGGQARDVRPNPLEALSVVLSPIVRHPAHGGVGRGPAQGFGVYGLAGRAFDEVWASQSH